MRIMILGGDGYLGWPTAMHFARRGHDVAVIDNYLRRRIARETDSQALIEANDLPQRCSVFYQLTGREITHIEGDLNDPSVLYEAVRAHQPESIIHYAEQPSAPYSMRGFDEARLTLNNNLNVTFNVIWAVKDLVPDCHIIKLGTMGEYGTPNIDIEEGWLEVEHKGRRDTFLYPRQAGSLYHTTKILDTDLLWFYVRTYGLRVTDLMQGPVYGLSTEESEMDERLLPNFHYDDIFGTVVNRFLVQAVAGIPLTIYGKGGQTRGYLNLRDTLQCVDLAARSPVERGDLRILNQLTETFTVKELADQVARVGNRLGLEVEVQTIPNPRQEAEEHYYNPKYSGLLDLGLQPHYLTDAVVEDMLTRILRYRACIDTNRIMPRVKWSG